MPDDLDTLRDQLRVFASERDWAPFHSPKNLACALSVEAAELLEHFQWMTEAQSRTLGAAQLVEVGHEAADVLLYLVQLADQLGIDLIAAARNKITLNAIKYPASTATATICPDAAGAARP